MSYLETLAANRSGGTESAASARSRFRKKPKKVASLTKPTKRAKLRVKRVATKPPGKESRGTTQKTPSEKAKMAKKSKRSKKRRSAAQRAATRKMLAANKAKRSGGKRRKSSGRRKARKSGKRKSAKRVAAGKKAARTRKRHKGEKRAAARKGNRKKRHAGRSKARHEGKRKRRRSSKRRRSTKSVKVVRLPRKASRVVVVSAPPKAVRRRRRKAGKRKSRRRSPKRYAGFTGRRLYNRRGKAAMENPMDGTELFIGAITGLAGFLTADVLDRFLATHALTAASVASGATLATYTDTPPTTGDYAGLFNATAICAPMNATRWLAGLSVAGVPLIIAHFVSAPKGRAALQFFGYAAGIRIVGKALTDAVAMLTQPTQLGQQLYDGEMRAAALKTGQGTIASTVTLPTSGLGRARLGAGKPCAPCASKQAGTGAGYPSAPRETTITSQSTPSTPSSATSVPLPTTPINPPAPPAGPATTATATPPAPPAGPNQLFGTRSNGRLPRRDPNWGYKGDE